jgi:hypothetical protein
MATGFAEVKGSLAVLVERSDRNERDLTRLREDTEKELQQVRADVEALKKARWPLPTIGVLAGIAGAATGAVALFAR